MITRVAKWHNPLVPGLGRQMNGVCHHLGWRHQVDDPCHEHAPTIGQLLRLEPSRKSQQL